MLSVGPNASFAEVFEAPAPGIYVFTWLPLNNGNVQFNLPNDQHSPGPCWMEQGDKVYYKGPAASLAGVRIGNELSDELSAARARLDDLESALGALLDEKTKSPKKEPAKAQKEPK